MRLFYLHYWQQYFSNIHVNVIWFWILFNVFILSMLVLDLGVFHKRQRVDTLKQSLLWVLFWMSLAFAFNVLVYFWKGHQSAFQFATGYVIEWSLSVDNLFVFILIFNYFNVPEKYQHRVLFWGILVALVLRGLFIVAGVSLFHRFDWMIYIFGVILVITALRMIMKRDDEKDLSQNSIVRLTKMLFPVTDHYHQNKFFIRERNKLHATPMFLVLMVINFTDIVFAVDSIPAVLAVSKDMFIVYTSNVFAVLGLRSMYFALSGLVHIFRFLKYGIAIILIFVGVKMLSSNYYDISTQATLAVVISLLALSILISVLMNKKK